MRPNRDQFGNWLPEVAAARRKASKAARRAGRLIGWRVAPEDIPNPKRKVRRKAEAAFLRAAGRPLSARQWKRYRRAVLRDFHAKPRAAA